MKVRSCVSVLFRTIPTNIMISFLPASRSKNGTLWAADFLSSYHPFFSTPHRHHDLVAAVHHLVRRVVAEIHKGPVRLNVFFFKYILELLLVFLNLLVAGITAKTKTGSMNGRRTMYADLPVVGNRQIRAVISRGHHETHEITFPAFLHVNRAGHGDLLPGLVRSEDISRQDTETRTRRGTVITVYLHTGQGGRWIKTDLKVSVAFDHFVFLLFGLFGTSRYIGLYKDKYGQ